MIRLSLDATNIQREKIVFELVKPFIPGFSVESMEIDETSTESPTKRKVDEIATADDVTMADTSATETPTTKTKTKKNKKSKK